MLGASCRYRIGIAVVAFLGYWGNGVAQVVSANDPIPVETQLSQHMRGLEQSWEVLNSRSTQPPVILGQLAMPDDETLRRQLQAIQGEFQFDLMPRLREFIGFFAQKHSREFDAVLGMALHYQPVIDRVLVQNKMPKNLRYLPIALSAMNVCAVSEHGNAGLWQMNYHVAIRYGLHCNEAVDERRDLLRSTGAALHYLRDLHAQYGDWMLSVAAYANGPAALNRAITRSGGSRDLRAVYASLPTESRDYIPAFVAACYLAQYHQVLGINSLVIKAQDSPDRIQLSAPLGFKAVADVLRIPESQLKQLNPVCRMEMIPGLNIPVQLCLPSGFGAKFSVLKDSIYQVQARHDQAKQAAEEKAKPATEPESVIEGGDEEPEDTKPAAAAVPKSNWTPPAGYVPIQYTIRSGDVLGKIAEEHGVTVSQIMSANNMRSVNITAGKQLTIYVPKSKASVIPPKLPSAEKTPNPTPSKPEASGTTTDYEWYTVKPGDNLWSISRKYQGVTDKDIMEFNGISANLQPGMKIKIPKKKP